VYEVGIDGMTLLQVGPSASMDQYQWWLTAGAGLAWQPHGGRLAVGANRSLDRPARTDAGARAGASRIDGWSPDGRVLAAIEPGRR
jgi:hypothetical protein